MNWIKFTFYLILSSSLYLIFYFNFGAKQALFSFAFSYVFLLWIEFFIFLPMQTIKEYSQERVDFNIKSSFPSRKINYNKFIKLKFLVMSAFLILAAVTALKPTLLHGLDSLVEFFETPKAFLTIDHQAFANSNSSKLELFYHSQNITMDSSSFVKIHIFNGKKQLWTLVLQDSVNNHKEEFNIPTQIENSKHLAASFLFEKFSNHPIQLTLSNGSYQFNAILNVTATPRPIVTLKQEAVRRKFSENSASKLAFSVEVRSPINLSKVMLILRTQSGFKFEQNLAEFINYTEREYKLGYTEVNTLGIPFQENDILYIKAFAKTTTLNLTAESQEFEFKVQSPAKIKKDLVQSLKDALTLLKTTEKFTENEKREIQKYLSKSEQLSLKLSTNGHITNKIKEIQSNANEIQKIHDVYYNLTKKKIFSLINALEWQLDYQQAQDLIANIQILKQKIFSLRREDNNNQNNISKAYELESVTKDTINKLKKMQKELQNVLTKKDNTQLNEFFKKDITDQKLNETAKKLNANDKKNAENSITMGVESAKKNIGGIMAILRHAHKKTLDNETREAEERAEKDDEQGQDLKQIRSFMEAIAAQGLLDESWRKNILDNITRLKKEGRPENSHMIDYLESQLR